MIVKESRNFELVYLKNKKKKKKEKHFGHMVTFDSVLSPCFFMLLDVLFVMKTLEDELYFLGLLLLRF